MKQRDATKRDGEIGMRLRAARNQAKMSQSHLGEALGVSFQQIQKYEKGVNRLSLTRAEQIAATLKVSVASLFGTGAVDESKGGDLGAQFFAASGAREVAEAYLALPQNLRFNLRAFVVGLAENAK